MEINIFQQLEGKQDLYKFQSQNKLDRFKKRESEIIKKRKKMFEIERVNCTEPSVWIRKTSKNNLGWKFVRRQPETKPQIQLNINNKNPCLEVKYSTLDGSGLFQ